MVMRWALIITLSLMTTSCDTGGSSTSSAPSAAAYTGGYIYIASGTVYAGNTITTATPVNAVVRYRKDGTFDRIVRDYSSSAPDSPVDIVDWDASHILVLVENASSRRVELVAKDGSSVTTWIANATALSAQLRRMWPTHDGGLLVSKGTMIEKFNSSGSRVLNGANAFIQSPTGNCATTATLNTGMALGPSNVIFTIHAAASPNAQINLISANGFAIAGDCIAALDSPGANHFPTAILAPVSGRMLVAFSNATGPVHQIYSYTVTATTIGSAVQAYNNTSVLQGISYMTVDGDGYVYVASANSTFNTIEKFSYNSTTGILTRIGSTAFLGPNVFTRSISGMIVD